MERLTCASAGRVGKPGFRHFLVSPVTFTTVVVGDAHPAWTLRTYGTNRTEIQGGWKEHLHDRETPICLQIKCLFLKCYFFAILSQFNINMILPSHQTCGKQKNKMKSKHLRDLSLLSYQHGGVSA